MESTRILRSRIALAYDSVTYYVFERVLVGPLLGSPFARPPHFADRLDVVPLLVELLTCIFVTQPNG